MAPELRELAPEPSLPIGEIKIDRSFVMNMRQDANDAMIVRATVELGRNLGRRVVAEGLEDRETWEQLATLRCDVAQGFYLSHPIGPQELERWVARREADHDGSHRPSGDAEPPEAFTEPDGPRTEPGPHHLRAI